MTSSKSFQERLKGRLQYGLLTQEILGRLARIGVRCYPYFLVREVPMARPELVELGTGLNTRFLTAAELAQVSALPHRPQNLAKLTARLEHGGCLAVLESGQLAAYTWYSSKEIPSVIGGQPLCALPQKTLYLYDAYVRPEFRGRRLAGYMRHTLHQALATQGACDFISLSLAFNKSTRRFKSRLGAQEIELRLGFTIARLGGFDVRLSQREKFADTPRIKRLSHAARRAT